MSKTKAARANDLYETARENPYVQRLIEDEELRESLRDAFEAAKGAYGRATGNGKGAIVMRVWIPPPLGWPNAIPPPASISSSASGSKQVLLDLALDAWDLADLLFPFAADAGTSVTHPPPTL